MQSWLPLTEYAAKHGISISTLRRRIKSSDIQFKFSGGKYLIYDGERRADSDERRQSDVTSTPKSTAKDTLQEAFGRFEKEEPILSAANKLLAELKKAYTQVLHEKEEQILQLKKEVADLKTLVRVLEERSRL
ncbi:MAG: hypothetical protein N2578_09610 [Bdellovibrionaceae bacterium]|nr:hypothetical protein [Pseudobdellovibrionaceae bacterium]